MEIKLDSKLFKAVFGLFMFAIAIIFMAADYVKLAGGGEGVANLGWLPGLFLMFGAFAICAAWYFEGMKDSKMATRAALYILFAIVIMAKKTVAANAQFLGLWATLEGVLLVFDGFKAKEAKANLWFVSACIGALVVLFGFIACFLDPLTKDLGFFEVVSKLNPMVGIAFLFAALGNIFPMCADFLPKCDLKLKK
jgi:hypothetical protein